MINVSRSFLSYPGKNAAACALLAATLVFATACGDGGGESEDGSVEEFSLEYPRKGTTPIEKQGSTHEIVYNRSSVGAFWLTAPNYDTVTELSLDGEATFHELPEGTAPHGLDFDSAGHLWVALEGTSQIARLNENGEIVQAYDLPTTCAGCVGTVEQDPHGLGIGADGRTIWYTGKESNTIGSIDPNGKIFSFALPTPDSFPIYIRLGPDGSMWFTALTGNNVGRVTGAGRVQEFKIPTANSRPIAIVPEPGGKSMWLTEEAGGKVARVDMDGTITEYAVPKRQSNSLLAGLAFDSQRNLWVQQYVSGEPAGSDYIVKIDKKIVSVTPEEMTPDDFTFFEAPTRNTVMHRIIEGPDGMWFTELKADKVGRVALTNK